MFEKWVFLQDNVLILIFFIGAFAQIIDRKPGSFAISLLNIQMDLKIKEVASEWI